MWTDEFSIARQWLMTSQDTDMQLPVLEAKANVHNWTCWLRQVIHNMLNMSHCFMAELSAVMCHLPCLSHHVGSCLLSDDLTLFGDLSVASYSAAALRHMCVCVRGNRSLASSSACRRCTKKKLVTKQITNHMQEATSKDCSGSNKRHIGPPIAHCRWLRFFFHAFFLLCVMSWSLSLDQCVKYVST